MKTAIIHLPESVRLSCGDAVRLNAWAGVAVLAAFGSCLWFHAPGLTGEGRVLVALLPLLPGLLYLRAIGRWMRTLDEMQRRLHTQAVCFAALGMVLLALTRDLLQSAGFLRGLHLGWEGYFALTFFLWVAGLIRVNRRYP